MTEQRACPCGGGPYAECCEPFHVSRTEAPTAVATAYKIVHAPAPTLAAMGHEVDPLLQATLDAALAKDRTERFASAADFADALAPITPHGAIRRQALATLLSAVLARQSTQAAPPQAARQESAPRAPAPAPKPEPPKVIGPIAPTLVSSTYTPPGLRPAPGSREPRCRSGGTMPR